MMNRSSQDHMVTISDVPEVLEVIREEQSSPAPSNLKMSSPSVEEDKDDSDTDQPINAKETLIKVDRDLLTKDSPLVCPCKNDEVEREKKRADELERLLAEKEQQMNEEFQRRTEKEINLLKDRFNFILQNEQIRTSYMLREAHRERKEKISALQRQLECKNLAGLMYVLTSERRKSKLEIMRITEQYTNFIQALQNILAEGQALILHLSRGYKTAARVDNEWRQKMNRVMKENFVYHYAGGTPETNQYFFDMPDLLKVEAPVTDNPTEDPCEVEEESVMEEEPPRDKTWWENLDGDCRPFVVFGDMADFQPSRRREVLRSVKAAKTAPKKWKEYVFNDMHMQGACPNADIIKDEYFKYLPPPDKWECHTGHLERQSTLGSDNESRRVTTASIDVRSMGSILKIITTANPPRPNKTNLLAARDSMEIASTTKLREKLKHSFDHNKDQSKVILNVGSRKASMFDNIDEEEGEEIEQPPKEPAYKLEEEEEVHDESTLGSLHNDSLQVLQMSQHVPEPDHKINYEKVCPMEKCQRMQVDSFIRSLPPYMRANPFMHFEQTFEEYEACSPEQLEILKHRIEEKKKKEKVDFDFETDPLKEWTPSVEGVAIQTSELSVSLPPCTCRVPSPTPVSSTQRIFTLAELIPMKQELNKINKECFYDDNIEFNRFKIIGQDSREDFVQFDNDRDFRRRRHQDIQRILKQHPSLCEIFQANIQC